LIKFAIACGVGPSLKVLQKRAMDVTKLLLPYEPTQVLTELAIHKAQNPAFNITHVHFFPLGGIKTNATWMIENGGSWIYFNKPGGSSAEGGARSGRRGGRRRA
jgi:methylenetetrahydrofolate reductase (NADPH)